MRIVLFMTQTVNGFIAHATGETPWTDATWQDRYDFAKKFPAVIVGRNTYELFRETDEFSKMGDPVVVVVTSTQGKLDDKTVFVETPEDAIKELKGRDFAHALLLGGAITVTKFLDAGLVNEVTLDIEPQLFSHGTPFLTRDAPSVQLEFLGCEQRGQNVRVRYRVAP